MILVYLNEEIIKLVTFKYYIRIEVADFLNLRSLATLGSKTRCQLATKDSISTRFVLKSGGSATSAA